MLNSEMQYWSVLKHRRKRGLVRNSTFANFIIAHLKGLTRFRVSSAGGWVAL